VLDAVPDLRKPLKTASDEQLADIFGAFDVTISYDKTSQQLELGATITPELPPQNDRDRSGERSRVLEVAGAGSGRNPATALEPNIVVYRIEESWPLGERVSA
jgi:hypothetical protein